MNKEIYRITDAETLEIVFLGFTEEITNITLYQTLYRIRNRHKEVKPAECYLLETAEPLFDDDTDGKLRYFMEYRPKFNFRDRERYLNESFLKSERFAKLERFTDIEREQWKVIRNAGDALTSQFHTAMLKNYLKQAGFSYERFETGITKLISGIHSGAFQNPAMYKKAKITGTARITDENDKRLLTEMWKEFLVQTKADFHFRTAKFVLRDGREFVPDFYVTLSGLNWIFQIEETETAHQFYQEFHIPVLFLKDFPETKEITAYSEKNRLKMYQKLSEIAFHSVKGTAYMLAIDSESLDVVAPFPAPDSEEFIKEESMRTDEEKTAVFGEDYATYQAYHLINMMKPLLRKEIQHEE